MFMLIVTTNCTVFNLLVKYVFITQTANDREYQIFETSRKSRILRPTSKYLN